MIAPSGCPGAGILTPDTKTNLVDNLISDLRLASVDIHLFLFFIKSLLADTKEKWRTTWNCQTLSWSFFLGLFMKKGGGDNIKCYMYKNHDFTQSFPKMYGNHPWRCESSWIIRRCWTRTSEHSSSCIIGLQHDFQSFYKLASVDIHVYTVMTWAREKITRRQALFTHRSLRHGAW